MFLNELSKKISKAKIQKFGKKEYFFDTKNNPLEKRGLFEGKTMHEVRVLHEAEPH